MNKTYIIGQDYVDHAEQVMRDIFEENKNNRKSKVITTSQIRNILSMISDISDEVRVKDVATNKLDDDIQEKIQYLKLHIVYQAGRDENVNYFVKQSNLLENIDHIGNNKKQFNLFCHYMEALVAYRKYLGLEYHEKDAN